MLPFCYLFDYLTITLVPKFALDLVCLLFDFLDNIVTFLLQIKAEIIDRF